MRLLHVPALRWIVFQKEDDAQGSHSTAEIDIEGGLNSMVVMETETLCLIRAQRDCTCSTAAASYLRTWLGDW